MDAKEDLTGVKESYLTVKCSKRFDFYSIENQQNSVLRSFVECEL